jgi:L-gulono-1,4-lactone dehydrogenase
MSALPHNTRTFLNWSRRHECRPQYYAQPATEAELEAFVGELGGRKRIRVVGANHSWSAAGCTDEVLLNLDRLNRVLDVDADNRTVTVQAGLRLERLFEELAARGLALPIRGSVAAQSVAGAISTGTHGSAAGHGNMATAVIGLRLVVADGGVVDCSREEHPEIFSAARVSLGTLGIVSRVTLAVEPVFRLEERAEPVPVTDAISQMDAIANSAEYVKVWWLPHTDEVQVFRCERTTAPVASSRLGRWFDASVSNRLIFPFLLTLGRRKPNWIPALNQVIATGYLKTTREVDRWDKVLGLAMPPRHQEVEYAIPIERTGEALERVRAFIEEKRICVNFIVELRFVHADDIPLSPAYGRDSCFVGAYHAGGRDELAYLEAFEDLMAEMGGRPHWGKEFRMTARELAPLYPKWAAFQACRLRIDPEGVFSNQWTDRVLGTARGAER